MNWSNVRLIFHREVRDQLRDRRTLFMIAVLPLLLYPLLGMSMFQVLQFVSEHATRVLVIGASELPDLPALVEDGAFAERLFSDPQKARLLELQFPQDKPEWSTWTEAELVAQARRLVQEGDYEAVVHFPPDFADRLEAFRQSLAARSSRPPGAAQAEAGPEITSPQIYFNTANEKSQITFARVSHVLDRWTEEIGRQNLASSRLPESAAKPFELTEHDVAEEAGHRDAAVWGKILPFLLLVWALTGAFYPAVDLCAGEKERGTLETLLSSPAQRTEIVWGKLCTVMLFSMVTAVLNLVSMGITGSFVMGVLPRELGPPPLLTPLWLLVALVPVSALFSALCLALAAFARSTKEGQYYLMPLMLVTLPLVVLPMSPGVELNLGNSLIPITGVVLLLRAMLEGNHWQALPFVAPVVAVTLACCLWAIRWAVDQFNTESVLFRESERLDIGLWFKRLLRERQATPSASEAVLCGVLILLVRFFMNFALPQPHTFPELARLTLITQLVVIATPALLMTVMLTTSPRRTLLFSMPPLAALPAAVLLAVVVHPAVSWFGILVQELYPLPDEIGDMFASLFQHAPSVWHLLLVVAVVPAICEEVAFRGFILSGLRHLGHRWRAIAVASFFFGMTHAILQQSIVAFVVGMLIGYLAVQSGSLWPAVLYHLVHNALGVLASRFDDQVVARNPLVDWLVHRGDDGMYFYHGPVVVLGGLVACGVLAWFHGLPCPQTAEESLQEALDQETVHAPAG